MVGELGEFDYSLAELIGCTVAEMRARISNREYLEWVALAKVRQARLELETKHGRR